MTFAHLHTRSHFSFGRGISSPAQLVEHARALEQPAIALTDWLSVSGAVQFQQAARAAGIHAVIGSEIPLETGAIVLLAINGQGYTQLNRLLTLAWTRQISVSTRPAPRPRSARISSNAV